MKAPLVSKTMAVESARQIPEKRHRAIRFGEGQGHDVIISEVVNRGFDPGVRETTDWDIEQRMINGFP